MMELTRTITIKFTPAEMQRIDKLWKSTDDLMNRSEFIRAAINAYAGEQVVTVRYLGQGSEEAVE